MAKHVRVRRTSAGSHGTKGWSEPGTSGGSDAPRRVLRTPRSGVKIGVAVDHCQVVIWFGRARTAGHHDLPRSPGEPCARPIFEAGPHCESVSVTHGRAAHPDFARPERRRLAAI